MPGYHFEGPVEVLPKVTQLWVAVSAFRQVLLFKDSLQSLEDSLDPDEFSVAMNDRQREVFEHYWVQFLARKEMHERSQKWLLDKYIGLYGGDHIMQRNKEYAHANKKHRINTALLLAHYSN